MASPRMSSEAKAKLNEYNAQCDDWSGLCSFCNQLIEGTLAQLKAHECDQLKEARRLEMN